VDSEFNVKIYPIKIHDVQKLQSNLGVMEWVVVV